jgi:acetone carboxylase alpha subunit
MTVIPIFEGEELIGWAGAVCHEIEIGGVIGGANMGTTAERFGNGLTVTAERIGQNDTIRRDYWIRAEYNLRTPIYWILDQKALLAACLMVRERVGELIESVGVDYYRWATRELIEESRRGHLERMRIMTVPGRYRNPAFSLHLQEGKEGTSPISHDIMLNIPVELEIRPDGHMTIDFDGATPQSWTPFNCAAAASDGILLVAMTQFMDYDGRVNDGTYYALDIKAPLGSCMNPDNHLVSIGGVFSVIMPVFGAWARAMSRSYIARGFKEEIFVGMVTTPFLEGGGINHYGQHAGGQNLEGAAQGSGARGIMDGIDNAYAGWNPESDMGNVEIWEQALPNLYLGRRIIPDHYGWGRYRGGATMASTWLFYKTPGWVGQSTLHSDLMFDNAGMCGGYPAPTAKYHHLVRGSDYKALAAEGKPLAHVEGDPANPDVEKYLGGTYEREDGYFHKVLRHGDVLQFIYNAGGGYGDPLERDPALVLGDLENGYMTLEAASRIHKVAGAFVESTDSFEIDAGKTAAAIEQEREKRRARAIPVSEWIAKERERVVNHDLDHRVLRCYAGSFETSKRWAQEFVEFWGLDADYTPVA